MKELADKEKSDQSLPITMFFANQVARLVHTIDDRSFIILAHDLLRHVLSAIVEHKIGSKTMRTFEKFRRRKNEPLSFVDNLSLAREFKVIHEPLAKELDDINTIRNQFAHDFRIESFHDLLDLKSNPLKNYEKKYRKNYEFFIDNWMSLKGLPLEDSDFSRQYKFYVVAVFIQLSTPIFNMTQDDLKDRLLKTYHQRVVVPVKIKNPRMKRAGPDPRLPEFLRNQSRRSDEQKKKSAKKRPKIEDMKPPKSNHTISWNN